MHSRWRRLCLGLLGVVAFVTIGIALEDELGIPFYTTYRLGCAGLCLFFIATIGQDYPGERWPWIGLAIAALINLSLFFTPVLEGPASRGEVMLFALPDAIILLIARTVSYSVHDDRQRAVRQQLILGIVIAVVFCSILFAAAFIQPRTAHP